MFDKFYFISDAVTAKVRKRRDMNFIGKFQVTEKPQIGKQVEAGHLPSVGTLPDKKYPDFHKLTFRIEGSNYSNISD